MKSGGIFILNKTHKLDFFYRPHILSCHIPNDNGMLFLLITGVCFYLFMINLSILHTILHKNNYNKQCNSEEIQSPLSILF